VNSEVESFEKLGRSYQEKVLQALFEDPLYSEMMTDVFEGEYFTYTHLQKSEPSSSSSTARSTRSFRASTLRCFSSSRVGDERRSGPDDDGQRLRRSDEVEPP
jgi:hypothetical protein